MNDHDMLVRLDAKVDVVLAAQERQNAVLVDYGKRIDSLESTRDQQSGAYRAGGVSVKLVLAFGSLLGVLTTVATFALTRLVP